MRQQLANLAEYVVVFSVPTSVHARYQLKALPHNIKKYIFRMKVDDIEPLYHFDVPPGGRKHFAEPMAA